MQKYNIEKSYEVGIMFVILKERPFIYLFSHLLLHQFIVPLCTK